MQYTVTLHFYSNSQTPKFSHCKSCGIRYSVFEKKKMESSRRAVESYRWSRLIDSATSDEDKITPVYKLEEICELLRSSHPTIVKELSDFILKRLDHKSPIVKHKALRLFKYAVGKSGVEFRREMQRHSVAVRQFVHYKGQLDPLKGDALNKAVRDTAHEAISAIFSEDNNNKPSPGADNLSQRIQGFGNTNFQPQPQDKKSFLSEVVGLGSASIKQGFNTLTRGHSSFFKNETTGSGTYNYKSPNLHTSFTAETEHGDRYEPVVYRGEIQSTSSGPWNQASKPTKVEISNGDSGVSYLESKTREDRLLETVVTSGGVRLQPTRDAIQVFLTEAAKLDALALCHAIERKLQSPMWQVHLKAVCVLESILRKKDDDHFSPMASYFSENYDMVLRCSESPQASLREKANKVLGLLGGGQLSSCAINSAEPVKEDSATVAELPDLIDTGDSKDYHGTGDTAKNTNDQNTENLTPLALVDDLHGNLIDSGVVSNELKSDDPFADVSFHSSENKEHADDVFSGMTVGNNKQGCPVNHGPGNRSEPEIDIFASNSRNGIMLNQSYSSQPLNYGAMGSLLAQQQFLATMANFHHLNNVNKQTDSTAEIAGPSGRTPLPDIFQSKFSSQTPSSMINSSKKEETKAFDFISDHLAAAYDTRRVI